MNAVTEQMVEAFGSAFWGEHWCDTEDDRNQIRAALTAALSIRQGGVKAMTVIDPDAWEPCSPSYLERGGSCNSPRVWNEVDKNHWHPKLSPAQEIADKPAAVSVGDVELGKGSLRGKVPGALRREAEELASEIWSDLDDVRRQTKLTDAWACIAEMCGDDIIRFAYRLKAAQEGK